MSRRFIDIVIFSGVCVLLLTIVSAVWVAVFFETEIIHALPSPMLFIMGVAVGSTMIFAGIIADMIRDF